MKMIIVAQLLLSAIEIMVNVLLELLIAFLGMEEAKIT